MRATDFAEALGPHLKMDLYECAPMVLADLDAVYEFLDRAPDILGMTKIMPPYVFKYRPLPGHEDSGISGVVMIAESHVSVHTWPEKGFAALDLFSCKPFDIAAAVEFSESWFKAGHYHLKLTNRGLEFPRNLAVVQGYMDRERRVLGGG